MSNKLKQRLKKSEELYKKVFTISLYPADEQLKLHEEIMQSVSMKNKFGDDLLFWNYFLLEQHYAFSSNVDDKSVDLIKKWQKGINNLVTGESEVKNGDCLKLSLAFAATANIEYMDALRQICGRGRTIILKDGIKLEERTIIKEGTRKFAADQFKYMRDLWRVTAAELKELNVPPEIADFSYFDEWDRPQATKKEEPLVITK